MGMSSANYHHRSSSLAREQSLRRCFIAIHDSSMPRMSSLSPGSSSNYNESISEPTTTKAPSRRQRGRSRRATIDTASPPQFSQRTRRSTLDGDVKAPNLERLIAPAPFPQDLPSLPFPKYNEQRQEHNASSSSRPRRIAAAANTSKKYLSRRSSAPITADVAQEMVTKLANEKLQQDRVIVHERRASRRATMNDYYMDAQQETFYDQQQLPRIQQQLQQPRRSSLEDIHQGFRRDYSLGDMVRSPSHIIVNPTSQDIASLQKHDFAFIKRSDGSYSYAILACRSFEPVKGGYGIEECMTFVMDGNGSTKVIKCRHWKDFICLVAPATPQMMMTKKDSYHESGYCQNVEPVPPQALAPAPQAPVADALPMDMPVLCREVSQGEENNSEREDILPEMITFDRAEVADEECSVISSVSFRARTFRG